MPLYIAQLSVLFLNWQRQGIVNLFKEELRTQNAELRMQSVGDWDRLLIVDHQIQDLVGLVPSYFALHIHRTHVES
ncbi:hypothetical protein [Scytonema sp. PCC 10023]|uniref:hypothetical protein n=1 Tax=Scytonema sp. PCC 10023 TaxID=1680591 RepID=UPI0039C6036A